MEKSEIKTGRNQESAYLLAISMLIVRLKRNCSEVVLVMENFETERFRQMCFVLLYCTL